MEQYNEEQFVDIIMDAARMCEAVGYGSEACTPCPAKAGWCIFSGDIPDKREEVSKFMCAVMQWANEHPEPTYPTWIEWNRAMFKDQHVPICAYNVMSIDDAECHNTINCCECLQRHIPADVAEKLGIAPLEV